MADHTMATLHLRLQTAPLTQCPNLPMEMAPTHLMKAYTATQLGTSPERQRNARLGLVPHGMAFMKDRPCHLQMGTRMVKQSPHILKLTLVSVLIRHHHIYPPLRFLPIQIHMLKVKANTIRLIPIYHILLLC